MRIKVLCIVFSFLLFPFYFTNASSVFAQEPATLQDLETVFRSVITWVAVIGGFLAFIAIIIGGFKYIVARGDPKAVSSAQNTITWAVIGLVLIIVAWLVLVAISQFTEQNVRVFDIPF
ncbi:MAG: pilin [Candidatus Woykebacteria bacterium]